MEKNIKIGIIEDNTPNRRLFAMLLKKAGHQIVEFEDALSSLNWFKENFVDCIIMDILLPDMNGNELIGNIRNIKGYEKTKIIAITGFSGINEKQKFIKKGFDGYISKPINITTFVSEIEDYLK